MFTIWWQLLFLTLGLWQTNAAYDVVLQAQSVDIEITDNNYASITYSFEFHNIGTSAAEINYEC